MESIDWNLLVLASAEGQPIASSQYQKSLFLLSRNIPTYNGNEPIYNFKPGAYGPSDTQVFIDAGKLIARKQAIMFKDEYIDKYIVTPAGINEAAILAQKLPPHIIRYVSAVVKWVTSITFSELINSINKEYPDMAVNSIFGGDR